MVSVSVNSLFDPRNYSEIMLVVLSEVRLCVGNRAYGGGAAFVYRCRNHALVYPALEIDGGLHGILRFVMRGGIVLLIDRGCLHPPDVQDGSFCAPDVQDVYHGVLLSAKIISAKTDWSAVTR